MSKSKVDELIEFINELHAEIDYKDYYELMGYVTEIQDAYEFTPKDDLQDWISRNWQTVEEQVRNRIERECAKGLNINDTYDREVLAEEISEDIKTGIMNVIETYQGV